MPVAAPTARPLPRPGARLPSAVLALGLAAAGLPGVPAAYAAAPADKPAPAAAAPALTTVVVGSAQAARTSAYEGVVEAVRQSVVSAQVPGIVTELAVKAGDRVAAGALLARIDARAAEQGAAASQAQVAAAQAQLAVAASEHERKRQLFGKNYISRAALDQAEAAHAAAAAQLRAVQAQAGVASTQTGFHVIRAPYAGVVAALQATQGDMAMPGRPLLTLYDPTALRVVAALPASVLARAGTLSPESLRIEVPALAEAAPPLTATRVERLPVVDPQSLTQTLRADLGASDARLLAPGQFARVWLTLPSAAADAAPGRGALLAVPAKAVVRRSELTAVYVLGAQGQPELRQVRLGQTLGDQIEVLAGLDAGERVVATPALAVRR